MLFNSNLYLLFLLFVVLIYYRLTFRNRQIFILFASYVFYWTWSFKYSALLVVSTFVEYHIAKWIEDSKNPTHRKWLLAFAMTTELGLLCTFKYANFFSTSLSTLLGFRPLPELDLILPLGISFYTFQIMSYTIDVYRGTTHARRSLLDVALFVSFFPHLIAGPIMRAEQLMPELCTEHPFEWKNIHLGIARILWGMMKKVWIADTMGNIVNEVYSDPSTVSGVGLALGTYAFAVQIYCDFSGYTDIALGSALLLMIHLPENFNSPYLSQSIREFWRRWHISLSNWLRDYLYISLGGNRKGEVVTYFNLMITMLIGGLWHGAGWNWVVWGGIQGFMLSAERFFNVNEGHSKSPYIGFIRWFITFHIVWFSWIFFRAHGVEQAWTIVTRIFTLAPGEYFSGYSPLFYLALLLISEQLGLKRRWLELASKDYTKIRWVAYASGVVLFFTFLGARNPEFIYFQF